MITSEAQWNEYFAAYIQGDDDLEKPDSGTGGTYLRVADQRPTFLGDMDAIFDLMAWPMLTTCMSFPVAVLVMRTLHIRIIIQCFINKSFHRFICISGNSSKQLNACCR